ncbi:hypothetical protein MNEG_3690 [Monoraphidium neglectum]|uniref:Auxin efflux carrier n=1 Tax=Monoraphidium neglectum TaxID=145388 RepID=A0A0D2LBY8_9CHLO|nr:hypothetical protein MNEG_3690 [Monoraphidium neglectum]KIZ04264.1 hypothetical protein MNEG_3690 [Monoraphidium neglectum]|eukprot:XP_013903283.1 hypothetical protein MNEG_3690 [Monoraphidium neglectum]
MNVFLPALLLSKLGSSVDARQAVALWPLAANMVACHLVGLLLGGAQVALLGVPQELRAQTVVIPALGNVGNLPLVLVPALLASPGMQAAGVGPNGGAGDLGVAYVMFGFFVASFIQFPVGWLMLQRPEAEPAALAGSSPSLASATLAAGPSVMAAGAVGAALPGGGSTGTAASTAVGGSVAAVATPLQQQQQQLQQQQQQQQQQRLRALAKGIFTPPVIACLLAVPVASVPELRDELFRPAGSLAFLGDVIDRLGAPMIPCLFLVLGANLAEGPGNAQVPMRVLVASCFSKLVLHPLAGAALVLLSLRAGLLPADMDPAIPLVMMIVWATPTAVLVHALATMMQNGADQVASLLFYQYIASLVTLPVFMGLVLQLYTTGQLAPAAYAAAAALPAA